MLNNLCREGRPIAFAVAVFTALGCAPPVVRLPGAPTMAPPGVASPGVVLVVEGAPPLMVDELRTQVRGWGEVHEATLPMSGLLADTCPAGGYVVLRPALTRSYFASNAGDRNALIIYESAIVVGLPVALVSLVVWPWYGETTVEGTLESVRCGSGRPPSRLVASQHVRSEGRSIARTSAIEKAQAEAAVRGVMRKLLAARAVEAANQEGGVR